MLAFILVIIRHFDTFLALFQLNEFNTVFEVGWAKNRTQEIPVEF